METGPLQSLIRTRWLSWRPQFGSATNPWNVIFNADGSRAIASNSGSDTVSVIDTTTLTVIETIPCETGHSFQFSITDQTKLYVSNAGALHPPFDPGSLTIIDTATWTVIGTTTLELQPFDETFVDVGAPTPTPSPSPSVSPSPSASPSPSVSPSPAQVPAPAPLRLRQTRLSTSRLSGRANWYECGDRRLHRYRHRPQIGRHSCNRAVLGHRRRRWTARRSNLELHDSNQAIIATNEDWTDNTEADQQSLIDHNLDPTNGLESAIIMTLEPGLYTAVVSGNDSGTGVALVELYDLDDPGAAGELANLSTRGFVGTETMS